MLEQRTVYVRGTQTHQGVTRNQAVDLVLISRALLRVRSVCVCSSRTVRVEGGE